MQVCRPKKQNPGHSHCQLPTRRVNSAWRVMTPSGSSPTHTHARARVCVVARFLELTACLKRRVKSMWRETQRLNTLFGRVEYLQTTTMESTAAILRAGSLRSWMSWMRCVEHEAASRSAVELCCEGQVCHQFNATTPPPLLKMMSCVTRR